MSYLNIQSTFQLQERRKRERDQDQIMEEPPVKKSCQKSDTLVDAKLDYRARHIREVCFLFSHLTCVEMMLIVPFLAKGEKK